MKPIIAMYMNIGSMPAPEIKIHVERVLQQLKNESVVTYIIPIRYGETRIECVYPKFLLVNDAESKEQYEIAKEQLNDLTNALNQLTAGLVSKPTIS